MDDFFPYKKKTIKSTDDPWMTPYIKSRIQSRKRTFDKDNRGDRWKEKKRETIELVKNAKSNYYTAHVKKAKESKDPSLHCKAVNCLKTNGREAHLSVTDLFPGKSHDDVAVKAAAFFTEILDRFVPLAAADIEKIGDPMRLEVQDVLKRIKECKKPKGLLSGDVWPNLLIAVAKEIAPRLTDVFNAALAEGVWPSV